MKSVRIRCFSGSYSGPFLIQILIQKCLFRTLLRNTDLKNLFIWIRHFLHLAIFYIVILLYIYLLIMLALLSHCIRAQFPQSFRRNTQNGVGTVCSTKFPHQETTFSFEILLRLVGYIKIMLKPT